MAHQGYYTNSTSLENINDALVQIDADADRAEASAAAALVSENNAATIAANTSSSASAASNSANGAATSSTNAANSSANAANSATNAANSATAAATSASNAATSASNAATSATAAANSATASANSASEAAASAASINQANLLAKANNLSDVQSVSSARTNLGVYSTAQVDAADALKANKAGDTFTGNVNIPSLNGGQLAGMRNKIINGDFRIWQRGTSFASVGNAYVADRWRVATTGTPLTVDWGNNAQVLAALGAAGNTSFGITQSIEAGNSYDMAGKTVTMAVTVDSPSYSGPISFNLYRLNTRDSLSGMALVGTVGFTGPYSVRRLSAQFNIPSSGNLGLYIEVVATSGITSGVLTLKEVQLEVGSVATPFEHRPYGVELALCKRYFQKYTYGFIGYTLGGSGYGDFLLLPVEMRATPTTTTVPINTMNVNTPTVVATNNLNIANAATAITAGVCINSGTISLNAEL